MLKLVKDLKRLNIFVSNSVTIDMIKVWVLEGATSDLGVFPQEAGLGGFILFCVRHSASPSLVTRCRYPPAPLSPPIPAGRLANIPVVSAL